MTAGTNKAYGIGAVVRRTGLSAPNIRMWEKRYSAVVPERTASNRRLYSGEDLHRLTLLRTLTGRGHSISNIANLSLRELQEQLAEEEKASQISPERRGAAQPNRVLTVGGGLADMFSADETHDMKCVAQFGDLPATSSAKKLPAVDLVVIETETLFPDTISTMRELVRRTKAPRSILVYHFTASNTATALARAIPGLKLLPAPVADDQLRRECLVQLESYLPRKAGPPVDSGPMPGRLYTPQQLTKLTRMSTTVECECPQHLAGLLLSLSAFEKYSRECEDRNPQDVLLHAFLHRTTAKVRRAMEEALQHVVETEGIALD